jgi:hypothetical protein
MRGSVSDQSVFQTKFRLWVNMGLKKVALQITGVWPLIYISYADTRHNNILVDNFSQFTFIYITAP